MAERNPELDELDRSIRRIDDLIASNLKTQADQKDAALAWQAFSNVDGGDNDAKAQIRETNNQIKLLQSAHNQLRQSREKVVQRRQRLLTRQTALQAPARPPTEPKPMPGSFPTQSPKLAGGFTSRTSPLVEPAHSRSTLSANPWAASNNSPSSSSWQFNQLQGSRPKQQTIDRFVCKLSVLALPPPFMRAFDVPSSWPGTGTSHKFSSNLN